MAEYRAVEWNYPPLQYEIVWYDPDIPKTTPPQYTYRAVDWNYPMAPYIVSERYVWIGPGGTPDEENAYWG